MKPSQRGVYIILKARGEHTEASREKCFLSLSIHLHQKQNKTKQNISYALSNEANRCLHPRHTTNNPKADGAKIALIACKPKKRTEETYPTYAYLDYAHRVSPHFSASDISSLPVVFVRAPTPSRMLQLQQMRRSSFFPHSSVRRKQITHHASL